MIQAPHTDRPEMARIWRQLGADYPFDDDEARSWFNFYGRLMHGSRFNKARKGDRRSRVDAPSAGNGATDMFVEPGDWGGSTRLRSG